jgi:hypothetical protein
VAVRLPVLTVVGAFMSLGNVTALILRQLFSTLGGGFPCPIMELVSIMAHTAYVSLFGIKAVHFLVLFQPSLRKR